MKIRIMSFTKLNLCSFMVVSNVLSELVSLKTACRTFQMWAEELKIIKVSQRKFISKAQCQSASQVN